MKKMSKYDVLILGGGTSGCACAYNCAKKNLKTLLVEKNNFLGGLMTGGLVVPIMKSSTNEINTDFYNKLISTAKKYDAQLTYKDGNDGWLNPELLKIVLEDILTSDDISSNLDILFETDILNVEKKDALIKKVNLIHNLLSIPIEAKYYVDASGYAKLSKLSNCEFLNDNSEKQQNSLRFILGNVDVDKFSNFLHELNDDENITNTYRDDINTNGKIHLTTACTWDTNKIWKLDKYLLKAVKDKILQENDRSYFQLFTVAGGDGQVAFNCPRIDNFNEDIYNYSNTLIEAKKAIYRLYNFTKAYFPGFENAILTNIATQTGVREENRVKTKYIYKKDDIISGKSFDNPALEAEYPIDIHSKDKNKSSLIQMSKYQLPIESLMSYNVDNLFVIGKILGAEFEAHSALRVQKSCMSMGEAIGKYLK